MDKGNIPDHDGLSASDKLVAFTHYFRGEMDRMNIWRSRLDVTTNWAIITTAAFSWFGFGNRDVSHLVFILAGVLLNGMLLVWALVTLKQRKEEVKIYPSSKSRFRLTNL